MSLVFGASTNDQVGLGTAASLLTADNTTVFGWYYPTTLTGGRRLFSFGLGTGAFLFLELSGTGGNMNTQIKRTNNTSYTTSNTPLSTLNKWYFVALTTNVSAGAGLIHHIYVGDLTTLAAEATYSLQTDDSGAAGTPTAAASIGNRTSGGIAWQGNIAHFQKYNRVMTIGEIRAQQFRPYKAASCVAYHELGYAGGVGTQPDWSGNGNAGTITGATQGVHVPVMPLGMGLDDDADADLSPMLMGAIRSLEAVRHASSW